MLLRLTLHQRLAPSWLALCLPIVILAGLCGNSVSAAPAIDFDRDIRPILANACFTCHGPDEAKREAGLRLDTEEAAKEYAIVPGDLEASEVIRRIMSDDPSERMPPPDQKQQLSGNQIAKLKEWITDGAPWSQHWAYVPPERVPLPTVKDDAWPSNGIDHFVLAKLEAKGLAPSPQASREELLRRVTLDLTGLPPTLKEIDAFLADDSAGAFERVVDRLLASPRYGEHMAAPWLAAARYADTNGYQNDATRTMWPWRDWVIRAMNDNMPFDQFTIEQLAGDLLPGPDGEGPTKDQVIATGFHRNHGLNGEGGRDPEESRVEYVIDRASTTGTVWLGLTVGCARCHDHKYDTISQNEFFELTAYFNSIAEKGGVDAGGNAHPVIALPTKEQEAEFAELREQIAAVENRIASQDTAAPEAQEAWERETREWLAREKNQELWNPLQPIELACEHKAEWRQLDDASVLVSTMENSGDAYVVTAKLPPGDHHGLRIEALRHTELTGGLFSNGVNGGFSVTGLEVELDGAPVELEAPQANYGSKEDIAGLLDKNKYTAWAVGHPKRAPETPTWLARFATPIHAAQGADDSGRLIIRMRHESRMGEAPIGRFRLSLTQYRDPTIKPSLGLSKPVVAALTKLANDRSAEEASQLARQFKTVRSAPLRKEIETLRNQIKQLESQQLYTMVMRERKVPRNTYRLERGLWNQPDKSRKLEPGVLACLPPLPEDAPANRLTLARWLMRPDHPLTARVTVNRYWQQFFGVGLVKTSEDFGVQGERPSHPELLDWLALRFIDSGWDVKQIHKTIMMSATYQQSSRTTPRLLAADPYNRLLTRGPRFRLSAQALRDQALAASGLLVEKQGGPGVMPYQPPGVWRDFSLGKITYQQGHGDDLYRRSIYTFWRRPVGPTLFFDNPGRQMCTVTPNLTNTPLHALTLLNDVTFIEAARALAERILADGPRSPDERIELAFRMATAREPTAAEIDRLGRALQDLLEHFQSDPAGAARLIAVGESSPDESLDVIELAAYTSLMNAILNLDEVVTKG